jgi:NTE family protein
MERPDVLVLGAGGTVGAAWMSGVLAGIRDETGIDFRACEHLVGTSAGAIVAADLLAGVEPRAPGGAHAAAPAAAGDDGEALPSREAADPAGSSGADDRNGERSPLAGALRLAGGAVRVAAQPLVPFALSLARPATARVRAAALARIEPPSATLDGLRERIAGHGLRFDGRLRVVCLERETGRRVVFGAPGAPPASVAEAVQASSSVPWTHRPVRIGAHEYVDGGLWSPTNLDAAPALRDTRVLCLAPTAGPLGARPRHPAFQAAATAALTLETLALRRRGTHVEVVAPAVADDPGEHVRVAGYRQGLALGQTA